MFSLTPYERRHAVGAYDPFHAMEEFEKNLWGNMNLPEFKTDIVDNGASYELQAELPGFDKNDIGVDIDGDTLTISAEHKTENDEKDKKGRVIHSERTFGTYSRSFNIASIKGDAITAAYDNGVLKLTLPKKEPETPASRRLTIE